jgi:hypothetical protein
MRTQASAIILQKKIAPRLIICGGSNFGVRYNDTEIMKPADFSFEAFAYADFRRKSEAEIIKEFLVFEFCLREEQIFAERLSASTVENAEFVKLILNRRPMFNGTERIAILTLLYHMETALPTWQRIGLNVEPIFAENVLSDGSPAKIERICEYYSTPKGGKQYDVERIRHLLTEGESLAELMAS